MNKSILLLYISLAVAPFVSIFATPVPSDATRSVFPRNDGSGVLADARDTESGIFKDSPYHGPGSIVALPRDAATSIPASVRDTETPGPHGEVFVLREMPRADTSILASGGRPSLSTRDTADSATGGNTRVWVLGRTSD